MINPRLENLENTVLKVERLIGTVSVGVSAFERDNAFACISSKEVAGMLENIKDNLLEIRNDIESEVKTQMIEGAAE